MIIEACDSIAHYGILRKSGRYPWGSGDSQGERNRGFLSAVDDARKAGMTEVEIAKSFGITTTELRAARAIAKTEQKQADIAMAQRLSDKGMSNVAIGQRMGINESSVRALLRPGEKDKADVLATTASMLADQVAKKKYLDVGVGVERHIGVSDTKLRTAVAMLRQKGYKLHYVKIEQLGTGQQTTIKVLTKDDVPYSDVFRNRDKIRQVTDYSEDDGRTFLGIQPPVSISSDRVSVRYAEEGGAKADGVIYVRRGVKDVSLGNSRYAQVRIAVGGTHYLKGVAMYKDNLPDGVDLQFNTNKSSTGNPLDAMKKMKDDPDNPFGSLISRQHGVMNIVNEEGSWGSWSRNLSPQMLSKQSPELARTQLAMTLDRRKDELDAIIGLTHPAVRKRLLDSYSDGVDSAAVHLKAAALPRQGSHVILPVSSLNEKEIYAPNYRNGESVVLVRYPHGGIFEIPSLTVNNNHPEAKRLLGNAKDAVGINHKVAERLSGADFDGDTVLVIPNSSGKVKTAKALDGLKEFDAKRAYPAYEGMKPMSARTKGLEMGIVSNLITDMTIRGATPSELARAVRHSQVVIDAEKHNLNYRQSAIDNGIAQLKEKYQGGARAGASTLISRAGSEIRVADRKPRSAAKGGPIDLATGQRVYEQTGETYTDKKGKIIEKKVSSTKLAEVNDAFELSSGTPIEAIYARHSNALKALANEARRVMVNTENIPYSPSAKLAYAPEVASLSAKLNLALRNAPLERQAQIVAAAIVRQKKVASPDLTAADVKKLKGQALTAARIRTGAKKERIVITPAEWQAIQAGAVSTNKLDAILNNADLDVVKELAAPKQRQTMVPVKTARAKTMLASGYTQAEVADALGVSVTTLMQSVGEV